jgi:hypothetical protein
MALSTPSFIAPIWIDANGVPSTPILTTLNQTPPVITPYDALLAAMQAISSCTLSGVAVGGGASYSGSPVSGPYPLATDQLRIQISSGSNTGFIIVPGPIAAVFESDGVTLNTSSSLVLSLFAAIQGVLGDYSGNGWSKLVGGTRRQVTQGSGN